MRAHVEVYDHIFRPTAGRGSCLLKEPHLDEILQNVLCLGALCSSCLTSQSKLVGITQCEFGFRVLHQRLGSINRARKTECKETYRVTSHRFKLMIQQFLCGNFMEEPV